MASLYRRDGVWYMKYNVPGRIKPIRKSLDTKDKRLARAKMEEKMSAINSGDSSPFPTRTPISDVLESFIKYSYSRRDTDSVGKDLSNLRSMFGIACPSLEYSNKRIAETNRTRLVPLFTVCNQVRLNALMACVEVAVPLAVMAALAMDPEKSTIQINKAIMSRGVRFHLLCISFSSKII